MKKLLIPLSVILLASCGGSTDAETTDSTENENDSTANVEVEVQEAIIDITLTKLDEVPSKCEVAGNVVDAYSWMDENGTNYFIRTITEIDMAYPVTDGEEMDSQYLYAYHYALNQKGEMTLLKETTDFVKDCEFDIVLSHELDALTLTDIDEDNVGEITFIYRTACTSDVSPSTQKLIMLENGDKYPLRGTTKVMDIGGEFEAGEEFSSAPDGFLTHAEELWNKHIVEYDFEL